MDDRKDVATEETTTSAESFAPIFGTAKDLLAKYSHCVLCGAHLHFTYVTDFARNITQESSRCPECGVKARQFVHKLQ